MLKFRSALRNSLGQRIEVTLPAEMRPPWRQPGEVALEYAENHPFYSLCGPWEVYSTERSA